MTDPVIRFIVPNFPPSLHNVFKIFIYIYISLLVYVSVNDFNNNNGSRGRPTRAKTNAFLEQTRVVSARAFKNSTFYFWNFPWRIECADGVENQTVARISSFTTARANERTRRRGRRRAVVQGRREQAQAGRLCRGGAGVLCIPRASSAFQNDFWERSIRKK